MIYSERCKIFKTYVAEFWINQSNWKYFSALIKFYKRHGFIGMNSSDMLVDIRSLFAAQMAIRTLITWSFSTFVSKMSQHSVPSSITTVALGTVKLSSNCVVALVHLRLPEFF